MDIFNVATFPPLVWWSGFIINFFVFSLHLLSIIKGEDRTLGDCLGMLIWAGVFAAMWPIIDGILLLMFGTILACGLSYIIYLPISMVVAPILNHKIWYGGIANLAQARFYYSSKQKNKPYLIFLTLFADYINKGAGVKNCRVTLRLVGKRAENEALAEVFKRQTENWSVSDNLASSA